MRAVTKVLSRLTRRPAAPPAPPTEAWFDRPDAADQIERRATSSDDRAILRSWVEDGYAIVPGLVPEALIDEMLADLDGLFDGDRPIDGVVLNDLVLAGGHRATISHGELLTLDAEERRSARTTSNWRLHGFFQQSPAADRIRELPELRRIASLILGVDSHAPYSINFHNGSSQRLHEDSAVFHLGVENLICGAWIACEDVVDGCGPLVYHPGSHRRAAFEPFRGDPAHNLRTATATESASYQRRVDDESDAFERHTFLARKGDVLLWHGMLIHGGEPIRDPSLTRRSYVVHFIPDGVDVADQVTGPTNW